MKLLAPAYGYPSQHRLLWDGLTECVEMVGHVIINPGSGPGDLRDPVWKDQISALEDRGVPMLGYLNLGYSGKPLDVLLAEASLWHRWYGILDFFLDCAPSSDLPRTARVVDILRMSARARYLTANAGTTVVASVAGHFDAVVEHEGPPPRGVPPTGVASPEEALGHWQVGPPAVPDRAWIVHGADQDAAVRTLRRAQAQGLDAIWITDLGGANPYSDLPSYWPWLIEALAEGTGAGLLAT